MDLDFDLEITGFETAEIDLLLDDDDVGDHRGDQEEEAAEHQHQRRDQEEMERAHEEHEAQVPPAVPERAQVRAALATVGMEDDRYLGDAQARPERHRDLQVRICGLSAYFVALERAVQDEMIERAQMEV
mgnify:CR=1 FL=1